MKKTQSTDDELLQLNLSEIVRNRIGGWKGKLVPSILLHSLEKLIRQEELNELLRMAHPSKGSNFSKKILDHLRITVSVKGLDNLPADEKFIFASNHPLGGLDGIALVMVLGKKYGDKNLKVLVNDLLMNVKPLANVFLPINKFGSQGRENTRLLNEAMERGDQIVMFPAGLVSRLHDDKTIKDLDWQKAFVSKALEFNRKIVPVKFEALNSMRFYKMARRRKKLKIKVNLEQALLPGEIFSSRNSSFNITFKPPVDPKKLREDGLKPVEIAAFIREKVYK